MLTFEENSYIHNSNLLNYCLYLAPKVSHANKKADVVAAIPTYIPTTEPLVDICSGSSYTCMISQSKTSSYPENDD